jgi:hypothetical protein
MSALTPVPSEETSPDNAVIFNNRRGPQCGGHAGELQLFGFSSLMRCCLIFGGLHGR